MKCCKYAPYVVKLQAPAILGSLEGDPNSAATLPYIPGSTIRGVVAAGLVRPGDSHCPQAEFRRIVLDGTVRFLNAYPLWDGARTLPFPLSLQPKKYGPQGHGEVEAIDIAAYDGHPDNRHDTAGTWPEEQRTRASERFLTIGAGSLTMVEPGISGKVHTQRDRERGHAWKDTSGVAHGTVFVYESLDADQDFAGIVQVHGDSEVNCLSLLQRVKAAMGNSILIGRSRRAEYAGRGDISWGKPRDREVEGPGADGLQPLSRDLRRGEIFRVLLTSPYVGRSPDTGQIDPSYVDCELLALLGGGRAKVLRKRWSFGLFGGFNRTWRLEVPQVLAASAGTQLVFEALQDIPLNDLSPIEHESIGERKTEGFGRGGPPLRPSPGGYLGPAYQTTRIPAPYLGERRQRTGEVSRIPHQNRPLHAGSCCRSAIRGRACI